MGGEGNGSPIWSSILGSRILFMRVIMCEDETMSRMGFGSRKGQDRKGLNLRKSGFKVWAYYTKTYFYIIKTQIQF